MAAGLVDQYRGDMFGIGSDLCQGQPDSVVNWMRNGHWRKVPGPAAQFPDCPTWFENNTHFPGLGQGLSGAGLSTEAVQGILGQNWLNFFEAGFTSGG